MSDSERTLKNLHVLGALSHNDKLLTNGDQFDIYAPTSLRGMLRAWYGECREHNIQRVRQTIRAGIACASALLEEADTLLLNSSDKQQMRFDTIMAHHRRMCDGLVRARSGLSNLLLTYREDAALASQIKLLLTEVDDFGEVIRPHTLRLQQTHGSPQLNAAPSPGAAALELPSPSPLSPERQP